MKQKIALLAIVLIAVACEPETTPERVLYQSETFEITNYQVTDGDKTAVAKSATEIKSNYSSEGRQMEFKFCILTSDDELPPYVNHKVMLYPENKELTVDVKFGERLVNTDIRKGKPVGLEPNTRVTFRLDLNPVFKAIEDSGFYKLHDGRQLKKADIKNIVMIGSKKPISWHMADAKDNEAMNLTDENNDGIYETTALFNPRETDQTVWKLQKDISHYPQYSSDILLIDALYNMSLEELEKLKTKDGYFDTGAEWSGVWTRDVSYSIVLSLAYLNPEVSKKCLMKKVVNGKIIQDTGTGGAWPISTDRLTWALAAYEVFLVTGDYDWLEQIYPIIKKSLDNDLKTTFYSKSLALGESSFLDWREQTYPKWMKPVDIYRSECLGTNAVHYGAYKILAEIEDIIGIPETKYHIKAEQLKSGINTHFYMSDKGYYAQFRYGRDNMSVSPRSEALGEALCILLDIADRFQKPKVAKQTPIINYGIPCVYPQTPEIPPYHNNGIWPFVQAYWNWAVAQTGNETALEHGLAAIYRPAALFLSNKENLVAQTGDAIGTEINSDRQLWSVAGNTAMIYRVFAGMKFTENALEFHPFVPEKYAGTKQITGFKYRNSILSITIKGFGNETKSFRLDGSKQDDFSIRGNLTGEHTIEIVLANNKSKKGNVNLVKNAFSPKTPELKLASNTLQWINNDEDVTFFVFRNGKLIEKTKRKTMTIKTNEYAEYQVKAVAKNGFESFLSNPVYSIPEEKQFIVEFEDFKTQNNSKASRFSGDGFVEFSLTKNTKFSFVIDVKKTGTYKIDLKYSNGNGPLNTENKCALRALYIDGKFTGTIGMPQTGKDAWSVWEYSNAFKIELTKGEHIFNILYQPFNENMNIYENTALIDNMRLIKMD